MAHVRLIGLQVEALAARLSDDLADVQVVLETILDAGDVGGAISGRFELVGDVGVSAQQCHGRLVERRPLWLPFLQVGRDLGVPAEVVDVLQLAFRRFHGLAQEGERFQRLVEAFLSLLETIVQQHIGIRAARAAIELRCVDGDRVLDLLEQVLVIDDVAEVLVFAVQPICTADRLEQAVVLHRLVDVEIRARRSIEAGEQLVHHDQHLHVRRFLNEQLFRPLLVGLGLGHPRPGVNVLQQLAVGVVDELLLRFGVGAGFLEGYVCRLRVVRRYHRALALERRLLEQREILGRVVDAGRHQDGVSALARKARLDAEVENNVAHHPVHPGFRAQHLLHRPPVLLQLVFLPVVQLPRLGLEPGVNLVLGTEPLVDVARLVDEIEHHLVFHGLAELVDMDVATEDFEACLLVLLEQRRARETDKGGVGHHGLHHSVQPATLGAVAFIDEHEDVADGVSGAGFQVPDKLVEFLVRLPVAFRPELVHERAE